LLSSANRLLFPQTGCARKSALPVLPSGDALEFGGGDQSRPADLHRGDASSLDPSVNGRGIAAQHDRDLIDAIGQAFEALSDLGAALLLAMSALLGGGRFGCAIGIVDGGGHRRNWLPVYAGNYLATLFFVFKKKKPCFWRDTSIHRLLYFKSRASRLFWFTPPRRQRRVGWALGVIDRLAAPAFGFGKPQRW
jgi:hypothetical protein